jgi:pimeloyl-ACP methyl ester carboxylesterase/quercetin dioxygenase-like cupin family protein
MSNSGRRPGDALAGILRRTELQRTASSIEGREIIQVLTEIPGGAESGWHIHFGDEVGFVLTGAVDMRIEGRPTLSLHAGEGFLISPRTPHNAVSAGGETDRMLNTYLVEAGQPLSAYVESPVAAGGRISGVETRYRTIDGLSIRFAESEARPDDALLLSPWPESFLAFDQIWPDLAQRAHLVAIDLPGYGGSERREELLSPEAMGEFIVHVADEFGLENPHVVAPDVGTAASLFAAALHPGRLRSLVVGSGGVAVPLALGGVLNDWVTSPDLDGFRHASPRAIVEGALTGIQRYQLPESVRQDYISSYEGDRMVESMRYVRAYPAELPILRDLLPQISTPVEIISGGRDQAVPPVNGYFLHDRLPHSRLDILDAAHFTWEDAADEYGALVTSWWNGGSELVMTP